MVKKYQYVRGKSIKDGASGKGGGLHKPVRVRSTENLGVLMRKFRDVEEILFPYVTSVGLVYEDMDCTIEEFADMTGADLDELIIEISRVISKR